MVKIKNKEFRLFIPHSEIQESVAQLGAMISKDYKNSIPVFIAILNGCFMFASDLLKVVSIPSEITFVKFASYSGMLSSGKVSELIGVGIDLQNRDIIIVEDIVDTGKTMSELISILNRQKPHSIEIASFLVKPAALKFPVHVKYKCKEISNEFVIGYGLDYDGFGRNYPDVYQLIG